MANEKKAGDILATAAFHLTGKGWNDCPVDEHVKAELYVSGAFQYGNGTGVCLLWENGNEDNFDTRYENLTPETFKEYAKHLLENRLMDTIKIEAV